MFPRVRVAELLDAAADLLRRAAHGGRGEDVVRDELVAHREAAEHARGLALRGAVPLEACARGGHRHDN